MKFSVGDLRAFASRILLDLQEAGVDIEPRWSQTVYESLVEILPNETDSERPTLDP